MGTSYYCYEKNHRRKHIGKQSCRWRFLFHGYSEPGLEIKSYSDWKKHLLSGKFEVYNEDHEKIEKADFFKLIEESISGKKYSIEEGVEGWYDKQGYCFLNISFS